MRLIGWCLIIGIVAAIIMDANSYNPFEPTIVYAENIKEELKEEPKEVRIEVVVDWTKERIEQEIREVFPEEPNTAVAIAKAEGGLEIEIQARAILSYGRERSFCTFQIHAPAHEANAVRLGYGDYRTNPKSCIAMARVIYDDSKARTGKGWQPWTAWKTGDYKRHL